jgi:hypothetical protein
MCILQVPGSGQQSIQLNDSPGHLYAHKAVVRMSIALLLALSLLLLWTMGAFNDGW